MPLTLSHPAVVLPLRRLGLPMTAMVAGSMAPDLPVFLGWGRGYALSHSLLGVATLDLALALMAVWCWFTFARDALVDLSPDAVRSRLTPHVVLAPRQWVLTVPAACVGALTHIVWDAFTHPHRWGVGQLAWLQSTHLGLPGHRWAQYLSGVLGLAIVCLVAVAHLRALPLLRRPAPRPAWATSLLPAVAGAGAVSGIVAAVVHAPSGIHAMAFHGVVNATLAVVVGFAAVCVAWRGLLRHTTAP